MSKNIVNTRNEIKNEEFKNLTLIDDVFFTLAAKESKEFVQTLMKPALDYLEIKDYQILSVDTETNDTNGEILESCINCLIENNDHERFLVKIHNGYPYEKPALKIRSECEAFDIEYIKSKQDKAHHPDIIQIIYSGAIRRF